MREALLWPWSCTSATLQPFGGSRPLRVGVQREALRWHICGREVCTSERRKNVPVLCHAINATNVLLRQVDRHDSAPGDGDVEPASRCKGKRVDEPPRAEGLARGARLRPAKATAAGLSQSSGLAGRGSSSEHAASPERGALWLDDDSIVASVAGVWSAAMPTRLRACPDASSRGSLLLTTVAPAPSGRTSINRGPRL